MDNDDGVTELSNAISKIMLSVFTKEVFVEKLIDCIQNIIMRPLFEILALLNVLNNYVDAVQTKDFMKKLDDAKKQADAWIRSSDNRQFSKIWTDESKEIPAKVQEIYRDAVDKDVNELIEEYIQDKGLIDEFATGIERKTKDYLLEWLLPPRSVEIAKVSTLDTEESRNRKLQDIEQERQFNKTHKANKSFKEREREQREATEVIPETREGKKLMNMQKYVDLSHIDAVQEVKKEDRERFGYIFVSFEKIEKDAKQLTEHDKNNITKIWYGDYFSKDENDSDDILSIVRRYNLHFKIKNDHINAPVNRLILQTYIVGLYTGSTIWNIYTIIQNVKELHLTMSVHEITPSMIHTGNVPNPKVQEVLTPIIGNLPLHGDQLMIRKNWDKMRFPKVNIRGLVDRIVELRDNSNITKDLAFEVIILIEDLSSELVKRSLTIEKFAQDIYNILKDKSIKVMTVKEIVSLLRYEDYE